MSLRIGLAGARSTSAIWKLEEATFDNVFEIAEALDTSASDLFFVEGVDDRREILERRIRELLSGCDEKQLRKIYRLILTFLE